LNEIVDEKMMSCTSGPMKLSTSLGILPLWRRDLLLKENLHTSRVLSKGSKLHGSETVLILVLDSMRRLSKQKLDAFLMTKARGLVKRSLTLRVFKSDVCTEFNEQFDAWRVTA